MALGEYTPADAYWYFQSSITSAKLATMVTNQNNIIHTGRRVYVDHITEGSYEWDNMRNPGGDLGHMFYLGALEPDRLVYFPVYLPDHCVYDRLNFRFYVCFIGAGGTPNCKFQVWAFDLADNGCDDDNGVQIALGLFDAVGLYSFNVDITGWTPGMYQIQMLMDTFNRDEIGYTGVDVSLVQTFV